MEGAGQGCSQLETEATGAAPDVRSAARRSRMRLSCSSFSLGDLIAFEADDGVGSGRSSVSRLPALWLALMPTLRERSLSELLDASGATPPAEKVCWRSGDRTGVSHDGRSALPPPPPPPPPPSRPSNEREPGEALPVSATTLGGTGPSLVPGAPLAAGMDARRGEVAAASSTPPAEETPSKDGDEESATPAAPLVRWAKGDPPGEPTARRPASRGDG